MEDCTAYHPCARCRIMTLCETTEDACPWRLADREALDHSLVGALCLECLTRNNDAELRRLVDGDYHTDD